MLDVKGICPNCGCDEFELIETCKVFNKDDVHLCGRQLRCLDCEEIYGLAELESEETKYGPGKDQDNSAD